MISTWGLELMYSVTGKRGEKIKCCLFYLKRGAILERNK
jgi:hypothetical protein